MRVDEGANRVDGATTTGVLVLNKPSGALSRGLVNQVARLLPNVKVGHAGTLDPLASGVLVVCIGRATRLVETIQRLPKSYRTVFRLGARSDTLDAHGRIEVERAARIPSELEIREAVAPAIGEVVQRPPEYSALKIKGQRAYDLARAGMAVELAPRMVRIDRIAILGYIWPRLELEIRCGGGTYIRAIARDVGEALGCGGYVEMLERTHIGPFTLDQSVDLATLSMESLEAHLRPMLDAVVDLPRLHLDSRQVEAVSQGRRLSALELGDMSVVAGQVALIDPRGRLVALGELDLEQGWLQPRKVLI
jgi:tRNA pseudouridine55 synthase